MSEPIKLDTTEIRKLKDLLDEKNIGYEVREWGKSGNGFWEGYNLHVHIGEATLSFLLSNGSYGRERGLIEFYDFNEEPTGWLTADKCVEIIRGQLKVEELEEND